MEQENPLLTEVNKLTHLITQGGHASKNFNAFFRKGLEELLTTGTMTGYSEKQEQKGD